MGPLSTEGRAWGGIGDVCVCSGNPGEGGKRALLSLFPPFQRSHSTFLIIFQFSPIRRVTAVTFAPQGYGVQVFCTSGYLPVLGSTVYGFFPFF